MIADKLNENLDSVKHENSRDLEKGSTQIPENTPIKKSNRLIQDDEIQAEEEIKQDPIPQDNVLSQSENNINHKSIENLDKLRTDYTTIDNNLRQRLGMKKPEPISEDDANMERQYLAQHFNTYQPPTLAREVVITDRVVQSTVNALNVINEELNLGIQKSEELGKSWIAHKLNLSKFIETLHDVPWKKVIAGSACIITIVSYLWQMGIARSIPQFVSTVISAVPMPNLISNIEPPKPKLDNTLQTIMEVPLTPITIVTSIGALSMGLVILKGLAWALRRSPK